MKKKHFFPIASLVIFIFALSFFNFWQEILSVKKEKYQQKVQTWRKEKNRFFKYTTHSPILPEQKNFFDSLQYFDIAEDFIAVAHLEAVADTGWVELVTTDGKVMPFRCRGVAHFELHEQHFELLVFQSPKATDKNRLFIPFSDATNGETTYIEGRYLETNWQPEKNKIVLDFNLAYNPFCAYNEQYSCPLPPKENVLVARIEAGEKMWKPIYYSHHQK